MKNKYFYVIGASVLALIAIIVSVCLVFLGNDVIKIVPNSLEIERVGNNYFLVTEYNPEYKYQFKLEQTIEEESVQLFVNSNTNSLNLNEHLNIVAGGDYKFSVCYATENGAGNGGFSQILEWNPSWVLPSVDYSQVNFDEETEILTWREVYQAERYALHLIDLDSKLTILNSQNNTISLADVEVGNYQIYIFAESGKDGLTSSEAGEGKRVVISRKNEVEQAVITSNFALRFYSSEKIEMVEIYEGESLLGTFAVKNPTISGKNYLYEIADAKLVLKDAKGTITIKTCSTDYVFESDMYVI